MKINTNAMTFYKDKPNIFTNMTKSIVVQKTGNPTAIKVSNNTQVAPPPVAVVSQEVMPSYIPVAKPQVKTPVQVDNSPVPKKCILWWCF